MATFGIRADDFALTGAWSVPCDRPLQAITDLPWVGALATEPAHANVR